jgi:hypothetical protein
VSVVTSRDLSSVRSSTFTSRLSSSCLASITSV